MNEQIIQIFIINLDTSTERRIEMIRQMDFYGLKYEFFEAVDGKKLDINVINEIRNQPYSFKKAFGREMTLGEIGCAMSHLNLYKKIVDEEIDYALILEDDSEFDEQLPYIVKNINTPEVLQNKLDLVLLGYCTNDLNKRKKAEVSWYQRRKIGKGIFFGIPTVWYWLTIGYLISGKGARKMISQGTLPRIPADFLTANSPKYDVRLGVSNKPIVWPGEYSVISYVGDGRGTATELKNISTADKCDDAIKISFGKQLYRETRTYYHKIRQILYKHWLKVAPKKYLYVSDKF